jgi:flagellar hook-associated protein 3 FlgL
MRGVGVTMVGRVTQAMVQTRFLQNMSNNLKRIDEQQQQLASGRKVNTTSDDPISFTYAMRYSQEIAQNEQYQRNIDTANSWLEFSDTMLIQTTDVIHRARELAIQGKSDTTSQESLNALKSEVDQLYEQLVRIGNSELNGNYIFNGQSTMAEPYTLIQAPQQSTDALEMRFEVNINVTMPISVTGNRVFGNPTDADNLFRILKDFSKALETGDRTALDGIVNKLSSRLDEVLYARSSVGARINRLEMTQQRLEDLSINLQQLQSKTEDADIAEVVMQLKMSENVYQASLAVGARIIRSSLIDFMR